jgi:hypothetical protein
MRTETAGMRFRRTVAGYRIADRKRNKDIGEVGRSGSQ